MMLNRLGVKEENFESFMSDVYNVWLPQHPGISTRTHCILHYKPPLVFTECPLFTNIKVYSAKDTGKREIGAGDTKVGR